MEATQLLHNLGQSIWLDDITRNLLDTGTPKRYIDELPVTGLTSNPTILENAIKNSTAYDGPIRQKLANGKAEEDLSFDLALEDNTRAADLFCPIHDRTNTGDAWVSLEVSPLPTYDTSSTLGLPAIEKPIFAGIPINVNRLFSREQYLAAASAFMRGINRRLENSVPGRVIGMETSGASAPLKALQKKFGFEPDRVVLVAKELLGRG